jgi:hypothetical protein
MPWSDGFSSSFVKRQPLTPLSAPGKTAIIILGDSCF